MFDPHRLFILLEREEKEIRFSMANSKFEMKMDIDRHVPRLMPNNCKNLNPPNFSLPSTFKGNFLREVASWYWYLLCCRMGKNELCTYFRSMRWQFGAVLPDDIRMNMCEPEQQFFREVVGCPYQLTSVFPYAATSVLDPDPHVTPLTVVFWILIRIWTQRATCPTKVEKLINFMF